MSTMQNASMEAMNVAAKLPSAVGSDVFGEVEAFGEILCRRKC